MGLANSLCCCMQSSWPHGRADCDAYQISRRQTNTQIVCATRTTKTQLPRLGRHTVTGCKSTQNVQLPLYSQQAAGTSCCIRSSHCFRPNEKGQGGCITVLTRPIHAAHTTIDEQLTNDQGTFKASSWQAGSYQANYWTVPYISVRGSGSDYNDTASVQHIFGGGGWDQAASLHFSRVQCTAHAQLFACAGHSYSS
jgi:hypothetical protein